MKEIRTFEEAIKQNARSLKDLEIKADKEKSTGKIDGAVATIMKLDRAIRCGNNPGASVYDDRGILFI